MPEIYSHYQTHLKILLNKEAHDRLFKIYLVSIFQNNWSFVTLGVCSRLKYCKFYCELVHWNRLVM